LIICLTTAAVGNNVDDADDEDEDATSGDEREGAFAGWAAVLLSPFIASSLSIAVELSVLVLVFVVVALEVVVLEVVVVVAAASALVCTEFESAALIFDCFNSVTDCCEAMLICFIAFVKLTVGREIVLAATGIDDEASP